MTQKLQWLWINRSNLLTMVAFRVLRRSMARDSGYAVSWHSNIAMAIYDESRRHDSVTASVIRRTERGDFDGILTVPRDAAVRGLRQRAGELDGTFCNHAAARFMKLCFGVDSEKLT
jgi:hypothetical protein